MNTMHPTRSRPRWALLPLPLMAATWWIPRAPAPPIAVLVPALPEAPPAHPAAAPGPSGCGGAEELPGVYLHSGEFHHEEVDLVIRGRGLDFVWQRSYRSRLSPDTSLGKGWVHSYDLRIVSMGSDVLLYDGTGRQDLYRRRPDGSFVAPQFFREGRFEPDGSFTLTFADQGLWSFRPLNGSAAQGRVQRIADRNGNTLQFSYDQQGRLRFVVDTLGRSIGVSHDAQGRLSRITDFRGRQVVYTYYGTGEVGGNPGDLKSVRSPVVTGTPTGNNFPAGKTTTYTYSVGQAHPALDHNLLTVTDPKGQVWLVNEYAGTTLPLSVDFDRLVRQRRGSPGDTIDITYELRGGTGQAAVGVSQQFLAADAGSGGGGAPLRIVAFVNDRMGNVRELTYDELGRCLVRREFTGRADPDQPTTRTQNRPGAPLRPGDPPHFETRWTYNEDSRIVRTVYPDGEVLRDVYELELDPGAPWRFRGNLRERHRRPGTYLPVGDQSELSEYFEYDTGFGGCCGSNFVARFTDVCGNVTTHSYDSQGNRLQTVHPIPTVVDDYDYNAFGQEVVHVWPDNGSGVRQVDTSEYYTPADGAQNGYQKSRVEDALGMALTTTWVHDALGNVIQMTDPRGFTSSTVVNALDQVVRQTSPPVQMDGGALVSYEIDTLYDANDNVVRVDVAYFDDQGNPQAGNSHFSTRYDHEILNQVVRRTQELDFSTDLVEEYAYDANRNRTLVRSGEAVRGGRPHSVVLSQYDERDLLWRRTRGHGGTNPATTEWDYDGRRRTVLRRDGIEGTAHITAFVLDSYGRALTRVDAMGNTTETEYNPYGQPVHVQVFGEQCDVPGASQNVLLYDVRHSYDAMKRLIATDARHFDPATGADIGDGMATTVWAWTDRSALAVRRDDNDYLTRYFYDSLNRLERVVDAAGNSVQTIYDENDHVVETRATELSDLGNPTQVIITRHTYDSLGRQVASVDSRDQMTRFGYDSLDNPTLRVDPLGNEQRTTYDGGRRPLAATQVLTDDGTGGGTPVGAIVRSFQWDHNHQLVEQMDASGNRTRYEYDDQDRRVRILFADGTEELCSYDVHGNRIQTIDPNGTRIDASHDLLDRLSGRSILPGAGVSTDTTFEAWKYDGISRLVRADDDDSTVSRAYDSLSFLALEQQDSVKLQHHHDGVGNRLFTVYPGGKTVVRTHDALNRVRGIENAGPTASYDYLGPRRVERRTTGAGIATSTYQYNDLRQLVALDHLSGAVELDRRTFQWDAAYNKTAAADVRGGGLGTWTYRYDSQYRLVETDATGPTGALVRQTRYELDGVGNRLQVLDDGCPGIYTMDATPPEPADAPMNQYTSTPCIGCIEYDANGNEVLRNGADAFVRDHRNRIVLHQGPSGAVTTFSYDALGRMIRKVAAGVTTRYYHDDSEVVEERDGFDQVTAEYVRGPAGDVVEMIRAGRTYFFFADELGSTRVVTASNGRVQERYEYADFGQPSFFDSLGGSLPASAIGNPFLFTGQRYEAEMRFYDAKARHFDPVLGRFVSRDPLGVWEDATNLGNGLTYAGNNPQTFTDPSGLYTDRASCGGGWPEGGSVYWDRDGCSSADKPAIDGGLCEAKGGAGRGARAAQQWLNWELFGYPHGYALLSTLNFLQWFAGPDITISKMWVAHITMSMQNIWSRFRDNQVFPIECEPGCDQNAYVYGSGSDIHLCYSFWKGDNKRRGGILLHELSHQWAGTDDHFYYTRSTDPTLISEYSLPNLFETGILATNGDTYEGLYLTSFIK